jgi:hypothetical protein
VLFEKSNAKDTIYFEDEFFEDFSSYHYEVFPRKNTWADQYAYINSTYADTMISLGVATLDAYDKEGFPYYSSIDKATSADTLSSLSFSFSEIPSENLYFGFFYQCGGKVSEPEIGDSLFLDFYSAKDTAWITVFSLPGGEQMHSFKQVILPITDSLVVDGFRFRFRNLVSLAKNNITGEDLGKFSNADQWHLDYIQIHSDSLEMSKINDMCMIKPLMPSLTEYTSMPYHHYGYAREIKRNTIPISYKTTFPDRVNIISLIRNYYSYDLLNNKQLNNITREENIPPNAFFREEEDFYTLFNYDEDATIGKIEIAAVIDALAIDQKLVNDTVKRKEVYYDHYAYDDGTAELGMGIAGEKQNLNKIAVRFQIYQPSTKPDTLKAILIYFNKSIDEYTSTSEYKISIRKNEGNKPAGDTLYTSKGQFPDYDTRLNEFTRIELDRPLLLTDTFFVVIEQLESYLNIGYDINNDNLNKIFFYTGQNWFTSSSLPKGSLMIRPSFGSNSLITKVENTQISENFIVYPNPATDVLYFESPDHEATQYRIRIFNIMGIMVLNSVTNNNSIDISALNKGLYIIQITSSDNRKTISTKFIKE